MEIISRKGGGLPQNYAETNSWLNPDPVRAMAVLRMKVLESLEVAATAAMTPAPEDPATTESGGFTMRRKHRRH